MILSFGENLKTLREQNNLTQTALAEKVSITSATISSYEKGVKSPSLEVAVRIAKALSISIAELVGEIDNKSVSTQILYKYSEVINTLISIESSCGLDIVITNPTSSYTISRNYNQIIVKDKIIDEFLVEWKKIKALYDSETIDNDLYTAWLEKQLRKYDIPISTKDNDSDSDSDDLSY